MIWLKMKFARFVMKIYKNHNLLAIVIKNVVCFILDIFKAETFL